MVKFDHFIKNYDFSIKKNEILYFQIFRYFLNFNEKTNSTLKNRLEITGFLLHT